LRRIGRLRLAGVVLCRTIRTFSPDKNAPLKSSNGALVLDRLPPN
jgi:hypothetical protein